MNVRPIALTPLDGFPEGGLGAVGWGARRISREVGVARAPYSHSIVAGGLDVMS